MHNVKPVEVPAVVPRDYDSFRQILAEKDAEIARLRAEVRWLREGGAGGGEPASEYGSVIDRIHVRTFAQSSAFACDLLVRLPAHSLRSLAR